MPMSVAWTSRYRQCSDLGTMIDHRGWDSVEPVAHVAGGLCPRLAAVSPALATRVWSRARSAWGTRSRSPLKAWPPVRQTCAPFARKATVSGPSPPCPSLGAQSGTADEPPSRSKVPPKSSKTRAVLPTWRSSYRCGFDSRPGTDRKYPTCMARYSVIGAAAATLRFTQDWPSFSGGARSGRQLCSGRPARQSIAAPGGSCRSSRAVPPKPVVPRPARSLARIERCHG